MLDPPWNVVSTRTSGGLLGSNKELFRGEALMAERGVRVEDGARMGESRSKQGDHRHRTEQNDCVGAPISHSYTVLPHSFIVMASCSSPHLPFTS
jgi:hypothetical protein